MIEEVLVLRVPLWRCDDGCQPGEARLSADVLVFQPLLGGPGLRIPLDEIADVTWQSPRPVVRVERREEQAMELMGAHARRLLHHLFGIRDGRPVGRELLWWNARVFIDTEPGIHALITLTTEELRVRPDDRAQTETVLAIEDLTRLQLVGARQRVQAWFGEKTVSVGGTVALALHERLAELQPDAEIEAPPASPRRGRFSAGWRSLPGQMHVTNAGLRFAPDGQLSRLLGREDIEVMVSQMLELRIRSLPHQHLEIRTGAGVRRVFVASPAALLNDLVNLVRLHLLDQAIRGPADAALAGLDDWSLDDLPLLRLISPALLWRAADRVQIGLLVATTERVRFLPDGGPVAGQAPESWPVQDILRLSAQDLALPNSVRFEHDGEEVRLQTAGGRLEAEDFWLCVPAPSRLMNWENTRRRTNSPLVGDLGAVQVLRDGVEVLRRSPGLAARDGEHWGLATPKALVRELTRGPVEIEVRQPSGRYRFSATPAGVAPLPDVLLRTSSAELVRFEIHDPIRLFNQRTHFRVAMGGTMTLRLPDTSGVHLALLQEIAVGGAGLVCDIAMEPGQRVQVLVPVGDTEMPISAALVRVESTPDGRYRWGVRFRELDGDAVELLQAVVAEQQRRELLSQRQATEED